MAQAGRPPHRPRMKAKPDPDSTLTLGQFIMHVYDTCAAFQAGQVVRLALDTQRVQVATVSTPAPRLPPAFR